MNAILNRVQTDWTKIQKTLEKESEVLVDRLLTAANKAANNQAVLEKRRELERLVETQYKKFEPKLDRFYKDLKGTAEKYGVNVQKLEKGVIATTQSAARRFNWNLSQSEAPLETEVAAPHVDEEEELAQSVSGKKKPGRKKGAKKA